MDKLWKPVALGKLGEFRGRIDGTTTKEIAMSFVESLIIPEKCKGRILNQLTKRGIALSPDEPNWKQLNLKSAIELAMKIIRNYKEE